MFLSGTTQWLLRNIKLASNVCQLKKSITVWLTLVTFWNMNPLKLDFVDPAMSGVIWQLPVQSFEVNRTKLGILLSWTWPECFFPLSSDPERHRSYLSKVGTEPTTATYERISAFVSPMWLRAIWQKVISPTVYCPTVVILRLAKSWSWVGLTWYVKITH